MYIEKVRVEGFRLLSDVEVMLEATSTVIVGRNNSGKTSLTDVFERFSGDGSRKFRLEDFSADVRSKFVEAKARFDTDQDADKIFEALPQIRLTLTVRYEKAERYGPLAPFIIDLDDDSTTAIVQLEYSPSIKSVKSLFDFPPKEDGVEELHWFYQNLRETLLRHYSVKISAIDPTDATNISYFENSAPLQALIQCDVVRAQRTLDHIKNGDAEVIGKLLGGLYKTATSATAAESDKALANELKKQISGVEKGIQTGFDEMVKGLLPALAVFGFPSLNDTELRPETSLNVESLLSDHTKIFYAGAHGVHLPEGYNGLGTRNLIYMLLELESFHKAYRARTVDGGIHLIFIEEPESLTRKAFNDIGTLQVAL
ncbi:MULTISPECIES: AAA family ATPase [unclassified Shinella]|uniref:AAA family ATPase n=1 Tax=unclassified Shinella TaxID=2643062 RepID=UPI0009EB166A|nr:MULTISPECIES: AAA family ATPase [unclassified Shinella]